jgi:hypothetical protein
MNHLDVGVLKCCEIFLNNFKGVVFYGVPHVDGTQGLSKINGIVNKPTRIQGYNSIRPFEKHGIFQSINGTTFSGF